MSVIRVHKNKNFTVMSNVHLRDMDLSLKAKGLLSVMLSLPDNWNYSIAGLCSICKENETAIKSTIKELKEKRYVIVNKKNPNETESKKYEYIYNIFEEPQEENQAIENQGVENLPLDNLPIENHPLNKITDIPSTDETNTDTVNTDGLNTDNNSLSNDKDNSKTKVLELYNSPVSEETKQETHVSKTLGRKTHTPKQTPLKDMPTRARDIAERLVDDTETADKVSDCISYFLEQYKAHRHKEHIHLTNDKLHDVVATMLSTITIEHENDSGMFESDYNPLVADNVDTEDMHWVIDEYFQTQFREKTDYSLVYFTQESVLTNAMNKCMLGGNPWYESHSL